MRDHFMTVAGFLVAVLCAAPPSAHAIDKIDKAQEKVDVTAQEVKGAISDRPR